MGMNAKGASALTRVGAIALAFVGAIVLTLVGAISTPVGAAGEIRVLCSNGLRAVVEAVTAPYERSSGHKLAVQFNSTTTLKQRIQGGEAFDVALLTTDAVDDLIASGALVRATRVDLARTGIGVGYRKGAPKPDVRTAQALRQVMMNAQSIAYTRDGASRPAVDRMWAQLKIADQVQPKIKLMPAGEPAPSVARGDSQFVLTLISEILPVPGVELAGALPEEFQSYVSFTAAASARAADLFQAQSVIDFVHGQQSAAAYKKNGMTVHR